MVNSQISYWSGIQQPDGTGCTMPANLKITITICCATYSPKISLYLYEVQQIRPGYKHR